MGGKDKKERKGRKTGEKGEKKGGESVFRSGSYLAQLYATNNTSTFIY